MASLQLQCAKPPATNNIITNWHQLCRPELLERIASFLPHNEVVLALRQLDKATAAALNLSRHKTVKASEPLPVWAYAGLGRVPFEQLAVARSAEQRRQVVRLAARTAGSLEAVEAALKAMDLRLGGWVFIAAAELPNDGAAVQLLRQLAATASGTASTASTATCLPLPAGETLNAAAAAGNIEACTWLLTQNDTRRLCPAAACAAARAGHARLATWLTEQSSVRTLDVCKLLAAAAHGCNVNDLTMLYDVYWRSLVGPRVVKPEADEPSAAFRPPKRVAARRDGLKCTFDHCSFEQALAAAAGSPSPDWLRKLDTLLSLHCGGEELGRQVLSRCRTTLSQVFGAAAAAAPDGLSRVRLLWEERGWRPADGLKAALVAAAARGDAQGLQSLVQVTGQGPLRSEDCFEILQGAVERGQLEVLHTLRRDHGVRCVAWGRYRRLLQDAAIGGHAGVARWLVEEVAADVEVPDWALQEHAAKHAKQRGGALTPPGVQGDGGGGNDRAGRAAVLLSESVAEITAGGCQMGLPEVVAYALGLGQRALTDEWKAWLWMQAARAASPPVLRLLAGAGIPPRWHDRAVYSSAAGDRPTLRMLTRLRCGEPGAHLALIALLEDPAVPLGELRWLLEGGGGGEEQHGGGGIIISSSGIPGGSQTQETVRLGQSRGPAAEALLSQESEWQQALEAVRRRGESGSIDVKAVRTWLEGWRQSQEPGHGRSGVKQGS
ncbi:hypothetical protein HXX76_013594 [Chlamydomonas incerta]|uniref:Ankyrin repeat domain-containing protein n=1 Tax=Chlamydomonas incerta TaxID=51695 RepID=A0A835SRP1_CHLIN|nr:hypothetical protein HXX76_013594 [Chlamydomonas incerta]|eukprot:KAG2425550.1 hypothetical protein HXX76_013594 [Chlamydomonas incerta]